MKTKEDLLEFYNVKIGKEYIITNVSKIKKEHSLTEDYYINERFKVRELKKSASTCNSIYIDFENDILSRPISVLGDFDYKEVPILTDKEREYLSAVIKPFRYKIAEIRKISSDKEQIAILFDNGTDIWFPDFEKGTMYTGMEANKGYTLDELGLWKVEKNYYSFLVLKKEKYI